MKITKTQKKTVLSKFYIHFGIDALLLYYSVTAYCIQTAIIKTCAYNNRFALKCAFGESYNDLYPGTIYSPPSYDVRFSSTATSS